MADKIRGVVKPAGRGYALGERNPDTLPSGRTGAESHDENVRNTRRWAPIMAWVNKPGGKYHV